jgi:hypothetical protein
LISLFFFILDPQRNKNREETEKRRDLIKKKYAEYKSCTDPEIRKRLSQELEDIHRDRLMNSLRQQLKK